MTKNRIKVKNETVHEDIFYKDQLILTYTIEYPQFHSTKYHSVVKQINTYYEVEAAKFQRYCKNSLFHAAVVQYEDSVKNGYPIHAFEAVLKDEITYIDPCTISLYFDQYEYTGGAHGNTVRYSDNWDLITGMKLSLKELFAPKVPFEVIIFKQILEQIEAKNQEGTGTYFEGYDKNIMTYFNPESFYLTPKGIVIYYQQYELAPYSSGISEFLIPYSEQYVVRPICN